MINNDFNFPADSIFLVTGGAGFIGSNLCEALIHMGYRVRCLDNLSLGREENIKDFMHDPKFEFVLGDIRDIDTCVDACNGVDYVLHQAALGSVPRSISEPLLYAHNNALGTVNMMEAARTNGVKKFVYASSSSVYGDEATLPKVENRVGNPLSPYAASKQNNEIWGKQYFMHYGLETYGLRYFNVFGRRQDPSGAYAAVLPKFISLLLQGKAPTLYGDGLQSRDFTYIDNVIQANLKACLAPKAAAGQAYNIGAGGQINLLNVYTILCNLLDKHVEPKFSDERPGDIKHSNADISKARKLLGYDPQWDFERGIRATIDWYKENS